MRTIVKFDPIDVEALTEKQIAFMANSLKSEVKKIISDAKTNVQNLGYMKTGSLMKAITSKVKHKGNKLYAIVGIDNRYVTYDENGNKIRPSKYSIFLEFGTKHMKPSFFLTKAGNTNISHIMATLKKSAEEGL